MLRLNSKKTKKKGGCGQGGGQRKQKTSELEPESAKKPDTPIWSQNRQRNLETPELETESSRKLENTSLGGKRTRLETGGGYQLSSIMCHLIIIINIIIIIMAPVSGP